jgi:hypothetical protein
MAHITLAGVLLDPTGEFSVGDRVRFTHQSTTGSTMRSAVSEIIVPPNGAYSIDLEYGLVLVEYNDYRLGQYRNLGVATVNATNTATSIPELLNAVVPASSAELIEFQTILSDCVAKAAAAEQSAIGAANSAIGAANSAATIDQDLYKIVRFNSELLAIGAGIGKFISRTDNTGGVGDIYKVAASATESDSPDALTLDNGNQAIMMQRGSSPQRKVGIYTTPPEFVHYVGALSYKKHSATQGELITNLDKYKAQLNPDASGGFWKELYVDPINGSDLNDGLTWETALKNADAQAVIGNYNVLHLKAGVYYVGINLPILSKTLDTAIVCDDGVAVMSSDVSNAVATSWTLSSGAMYSIDLTGQTSTITSCLDLKRFDDVGNYKSYVWKATQAEVIAEAGTYTYAGTFAYVHTLDGVSPTKDRILLNTASTRFEFQVRAGQKYYVKNIHFVGGTASGSTVVVNTFAGAVNPNSIFYAEGCKFGGIDRTHWNVGNALELLDIDLGVFVDCSAGDAPQDGFNYHGYINNPSIIEYNCYGGSVGKDNNDNASTAHDGISIFRLNCNYGITTGPAIADVNNSLSYNACVVSYLGRHNLQFDGGVKAWVNGYTGYLSSINDIYLTSGAVGVSELHVVDNHTDKSIVSDGVYTIDTTIT